jgi:rhodanese-related sulfurtransferase
MTIDDVLEAARRGVQRILPAELAALGDSDVLIVDTRTEAQRRAQGEMPRAVVIDRTVLEWRLDPTSGSRIAEARGYDLPVVVVCRQGYSSSLAAASLRSIGLHRATDLVGGFEGWVAAGLPVAAGPPDVRT